MQDINLKTWEEFEKELEKLNTESEQLKSKESGYVSQILFRGQSDSTQPLDSTINREISCMEFSTYLEQIRNIVNTISAYTDSDWNISEKISSYLKEPLWNLYKLLPENNFLKIVEFMVYLRHHGFLSPLLDWSRSPYIAAFFAFEKTDKENIAIFAFREYCCHGKSFMQEDPHIIGIGPNLRTHKRHFLQQTEYTVCGKKKDKEFIFCSYEEVKSPINESEQYQDVIRKYIIPSGEQNKVIKKLKLMNITKYSLFSTEDALIQSLSMDMMLNLKVKK
ncbi:MAG: FRG domain-containing protein [Sedimentisphaerales bacterium]|nr:FRG domain-containing protein [Sedimentisphaerales bacterium]